jgi:N-acetylglutamate synthase-like GNAT family acetyltransferase
MIEIKSISSGNISDLYSICTPAKEENLKASKESAEFFLEKQKAGWKGLVLYDDKLPVGRAEFHPLEESFQAVTGDNLYFMPCFWIKPGYEKKGYGRKLMEELMRMTSDRKGLATVTATRWMPQEFFQKFGFEKVQEKGVMQLLLKKNQKDASCYWFEPSFVSSNQKDRINIDLVYNLGCPYMVANWRNLIRKAKEVTDKLVLNIYQQKDRKDLEGYGEANIYIDGDTPFYGPASEEEIEKIIKEHLKRKGL